MYTYVIEIFYSEKDDRYLAVVPELMGCSAFGETEEKAREEVKIVMGLWLKAAENLPHDVTSGIHENVQSMKG